MDKDPITPGSQNKNTATAGAPVTPNIETFANTVPESNPTPVNNPQASSAATSQMVTEPTMTGMSGWSTVEPAAAATTNTAATATNIPQSSVVAPATPPKKKRTGLIITLVVVLVLLLAGVGVAAWYFLYRNNPEKIAFEAVNGFLQEKNVTVTGDLWVEQRNDYSDTKLRYDLSLKNSTADKSGVSDIVFRGSQSGPSQSTPESFELTLGSVVMSDGVFYLRVGQLMDLVDYYLESSGLSKQDLDAGGMLTYQLADTFDEEWWRISVPEILDALVDQLEIDDSDILANFQSIKELYRCVVDVANQDIAKEIADLYSKNRFIVINKVDQSANGSKKPADGNSLYQVEFDYAKLANFINGLPHLKSANDAYVCVNKYYEETSSSEDPVGPSDFDEVTAEELEASRHEADVQYYLEISDQGNQLKSIFMQSENEEAIGEMNLYFNYSPVTIAAPVESRPITDLLEEAVTVIMNLLLGDSPLFGNSYPGLDTGGYGNDCSDIDYNDEEAYLKCLGIDPDFDYDDFYGDDYDWGWDSDPLGEEA